VLPRNSLAEKVKKWTVRRSLIVRIAFCYCYNVRNVASGFREVDAAHSGSSWNVVPLASLSFSRICAFVLFSFSLSLSLSFSLSVFLSLSLFHPWYSHADGVPASQGEPEPLAPSSHLSLSLLPSCFLPPSLSFSLPLSLSFRLLKTRTFRSRLTRFVRFEWVCRNARVLIYRKNSHACGKSRPPFR